MTLTRLVVAADVETLAALKNLVTRTASLRSVTGYKIGALSAVSCGLAEAVRCIREHTDKTLIYDHQKAGNDIPDIVGRVVTQAHGAGADAIVLFPFAGPDSLRAGVESGASCGIKIIVGGHMTHPHFLASDGGYVATDAPARIYDAAAGLGVRDFVVPGNQPALAARYGQTLADQIGSVTLWAPGLGRQGGTVQELRASLPSIDLNVIVGSSLYLADDPGAEAHRMLGSEALA